MASRNNNNANNSSSSSVFRSFHQFYDSTRAECLARAATR